MKTQTMEFTESQKKAIQTIDRNVCVSAGAGTGKTRVLVERFLHLVESGKANPNEILAITFTEKAAQEMKQRISDAMRKSGLEAARRQLENAYIGTIHSFCSRMLHEHPIEAGVDPKFRTLEEDEAHLFKESVLNDLIETRFQEKEVFQLLKLYSEDKIKKGIVFTLEKMHSSGMSQIPEYDRTELTATVKKKVLACIQKIQAIDTKKIDDLKILKSEIERPISNWDDLEKIKEADKFKKQGPAKTEIEDLKLTIEEYVAIYTEMFGVETKNIFLNLVSDFSKRYVQLKRERSVLDFNDLEQKALILLTIENPSSIACRNLYRNHFKYIMVDEFQDTSLVQNQIISSIVSKHNLFVVGDWKQSIYAFRGAQPELLLSKKIEFEKEDGGNISLTDNFRSTPDVLELINGFFGDIWKGREFEFLKPTQKSEKKKKAVEFLSIERSEDQNVNEGRMNEAKVLAHKIQDLVETENYEYKDFAMLFRVATDMYLYEYELKNLGIPYYVVSGRGFYKQPEVKDLISFLEILENPHLDIPLASVLRSPLVQISDDALFWLAEQSKRKDKNIPLYDALLKHEQIQELSDQDQERLRFFKPFFIRLLSNKERWAISECISKILAHTQYDRYVLSLAHGKRHFANIRKLLEMARELENRESIHLGDFIRYVKSLETQEVRESEAQVEALEGNVVKLMTVHKSKGLEFKVVVLPDLNRKGEKRSMQFVLDPEFGLGFKVFNPVSHEFEETWTYQKIKQKIIRTSNEEAKRLLYVGMTRSKERIILSGISKEVQNDSDFGGFDDGANWYKWLDEWTMESNLLTKQLISAPKQSEGRVASPLAEHKQVHTAILSGTPIKKETSEEADSIIESLKPIEPTFFERIDIPVTAYGTFQHNVEEYLNTYELGVLPEEQEKEEEWEEIEEEEKISPADFGTVIHSIFEYLVVNPPQAKNRYKQIVERCARDLDEQTVSEITKLTEQFLESEQFNEIKQAKKRHAEIPFVLRLKHGVIQETLDLLYQTAKGEWVILDYKTSQVTKQGELPLLGNLVEHYELQMKLYALACYELLKIPVSKMRLYFVRAQISHDFELKETEIKSLRVEFEVLQKKIIKFRKSVILSEAKNL